MKDKVIEFAFDFWLAILNFASTILAGTWLEIMFGLLGITGAVFTVHLIHAKVRGASLTLSAATAITLIFAILLWIAIIVAIVSKLEVENRTLTREFAEWIRNFNK